MNEQPPKRDWFYWFIAFITVSQLPITILIIVDFLLHPLEPDYVYQSVIFRQVVSLVAIPLVVLVVQLILRRNPYNVTSLFLTQWATAIVASTVRSDTQILFSLSSGYIGIFFLPLFFPNGKVVPPRYQTIIRWLYVIMILSRAFSILSSRLVGTPPNIPNPAFVRSLEFINPLTNGIFGLSLVPYVIIVIPSIIIRYQVSNQHERNQIKWFAWSFFVIIFTTLLVTATGINSSDPTTFTTLESIIVILWGMFLLFAPFFAVSYAILRHRLYDIDIIIRRTLIYSILSAILAGVYLGTVIFVQQLFQSATGDVPDFAIVISTLLIAGLFTPVRRRVQDVIDRRFYRRKYNVEQTLAQFSQTLRDEVDIEVLKGQLVSVVQDTMQPSSIRLWVKENKS